MRSTDRLAQGVLSHPIRVCQASVMIHRGIVVLLPQGKQIGPQVVAQPLERLWRPSRGVAGKEPLAQLPTKCEMAGFLLVM